VLLFLAGLFPLVLFFEEGEALLPNAPNLNANGSEGGATAAAAEAKEAAATDGPGEAPKTNSTPPDAEAPPEAAEFASQAAARRLFSSASSWINFASCALACSAALISHGCTTATPFLHVADALTRATPSWIIGGAGAGGAAEEAMGEEAASGDGTAAGSEASSLSSFFSPSSACPCSFPIVSAVSANSTPACVVSSASAAACGGTAAAAEEEDDEEDAEGSDDMRTGRNVGRTEQKKKAGALCAQLCNTQTSHSRMSQNTDIRSLVSSALFAFPSLRLLFRAVL
jgi:hypothetical protein